MLKAHVISLARMFVISLMDAFNTRDQFWISHYETRYVNLKKNIKVEVNKLLKSELKNIGECNYDAETTALFLDFMKRHNLLTCNDPKIGL